MIVKNFALAALAATVAFAGTANAQTRDQIRIVGSSTVFPFSSAVAENFGRGGSFKTPIVESTGTGGGLKLFCAGVGVQHPDITGASRRIKKSELEQCARNGVEKVTEVVVGFDGIVIANAKSAKAVNFTQEQLWKALAKTVPVNGQMVANPYRKWSDIDPSLPAQTIEVYGPPPTSGTRDAFVELVMHEGCKNIAEVKALPEDARKTACEQVREDGVFVEAGENDNLIVQKLTVNPGAFGIFGYSFLERNADQIQGSAVAGVKPEYELIQAGEYPVSRPLYIYVKNAHAGVIPGIKEFLAEYTSERAVGEDGYLADKGLIALPQDMWEKTRAAAANMVPVAM